MRALPVQGSNRDFPASGVRPSRGELWGLTAMKGAARGGWPPRAQHSSLRREERSREAFMERYVGLDLSRKRLNWCWVDDRCEVVGEGAVAPRPHGLARLVLELGEDVVAVIESMTGARF